MLAPGETKTHTHTDTYTIEKGGSGERDKHENQIFFSRFDHFSWLSWEKNIAVFKSNSPVMMR